MQLTYQAQVAPALRIQVIASLVSHQMGYKGLHVGVLETVQAHINKGKA